MKRVCILLSSYNGEAYIQRQIETIFAQRAVEVTLLIRDDDSSDRTVEIIQNQQQKYSNIHLVTGKNLGWKSSFMKLILLVQDFGAFDYYGFADQDDIWLPDKCSAAINMLEKYRKKPALYGSNLDIVDDQLTHLRMLYNTRADYQNIFRQYCLGGTVYGCTMIWNAALQEILVKKTPYVDTPHDWWLMLCAVSLGVMVVDRESHILHLVMHGNAAGVEKNQLKRIIKFFQVYMNPSYVRASDIVACFLDLYGDMEIKSRDYLEQVAGYRHKKGGEKALMCDAHISSLPFKSRIRKYWFIALKLL